MQRLPSQIGVHRIRKGSALHKLVVRTIQEIATEEDKSFSYVVAEIVYAFFGLKIGSNDVVKISWAGREKKAGKRNRVTRRRNVRRVAAADVLPFEKRRNAKKIA